MLYAYKCRHCGAKLDAPYHMGFAPSEVQCPTCGEQMRRDYSQVGFACVAFSRDLYAEKLKKGARKGTQARRRGEL